MMRRVLSPEERALWRRVTADIRETGASVAPAPPEAARPSAPRLSPARPAIRPADHDAIPRVAVHRATLDGKWDRELKSGKVMPDRMIDLHGSTLAQAHRQVLVALEGAIAAGDRLVVIVTGRAPGPGTTRLDRPLRGIIRASITDWLHGAPFAGRIAAIRPAHPRHGGAGAIYVILRRQGRP
jgi:DNA-nicking Smr family endonuclease